MYLPSPRFPVPCRPVSVGAPLDTPYVFYAFFGGPRMARDWSLPGLSVQPGVGLWGLTHPTVPVVTLSSILPCPRDATFGMPGSHVVM